jgi:imidazolonepropionase-like amidohydrolase
LRLQKASFVFATLFGLAASLVLSAGARAEAQAQAQAQAQDKLALVGGMLLDGYEVPPVHHAAVLVEGERIVRVGRAAEIDIPADYRMVDTRGRTMLPGLIDLHAHLMILGHGDYSRWFSWLEREGISLESVMEISAAQLLDAGVTTAVDLGGPLDASLSVRDRIGHGDLRGPRMLIAGPWVARREWSVLPIENQRLVSSSEEASAATEELARAGVDVIKAWAGLTREDYDAIVSTAHRYDKQVHAHVYGPEEVRNALEAGVDVLQHVGSAGTPAYDEELLRAIAESGRPVVPTGAHRVWVFPATVRFPERLQDPRLRVDFPGVIYDEVQRSFESFHTVSYFATTPRQMFYGEESLGQWISSGAVVGMGTDSGTPMNFHTEALWREMKSFVDLGMSPLAAISAATRVNARILGMGRELGTIEPGKLADIIVVKGDPLFNIMALADVEIVVKGGRVEKENQARK